MASLKQPAGADQPWGGMKYPTEGFQSSITQPVAPDNMWTNQYDIPTGAPINSGMTFQSFNEANDLAAQYPDQSGGAPQPAPTEGGYQPPSSWAAPAPDMSGPADPGQDPFAAMGGGVYADGGWKPLSMVQGSAPTGAPTGTPVGLTSSQSGSVQASKAPAGGMQNLYSMLDKLLSTGGGYNQSVVDQRVGAARDTLETQRSAELDTLRGLLADRGLLGDGAELESYGNMGTRLGTAYGQQVADILGEESQNADSRLLAAIASATGLSTADANRLIADYEAQTGRMVGMANADAAGKQAQASLTSAEGMLGLNQDKLSLDAYSSQADRDLEFQMWYFGPNGPGGQLSEGYV